MDFQSFPCSEMANLAVSSPRVEGVEIVSLEPIQNWPGPTICMQKNGEWVCLPARLIFRRASAA